MRLYKVCVISQIEALFPSGPRVLQVAIPKEYIDCQNCDTLYLNSHYQYALHCCTLEKNQMKAAIIEIERLVLSSLNHILSRASLGENSFKVTVSTLGAQFVSFNKNRPQKYGI